EESLHGPRSRCGAVCRDLGRVEHTHRLESLLPVELITLFHVSQDGAIEIELLPAAERGSGGSRSLAQGGAPLRAGIQRAAAQETLGSTGSGVPVFDRELVVGVVIGMDGQTELLQV